MTLDSYTESLFIKASENRIPLSASFELTAECNFDCRMCYIHGMAGEDLGTEEWLNIAQEARNRGTLFLLLTGGEPLVREDFAFLYRELHSMGFIISLNTNGSLIDREMLKLFDVYRPDKINVSLYGSSEKTYERLCGSGISHEPVYNNVLNLKKAGIRVRLNYTATPYNSADADDIYRFAAENDIALRSDSYMFPGVRKNRSLCFDRFTPAEYAVSKMKYDRFRFGSEYMLRKKSSLTGGNGTETADECAADTERGKISCRAGKSGCWITCRGDMLPCGMMTRPKISVLSSGFGAAWDYISREREKITVPDRCVSCVNRRICDSCPAVCSAETGDFGGVPEYCCACAEEYAKLYKTLT